MRYPFGQAACDVATGGLETFARSGEGGAAPSPALRTRIRNAARCQAAKTSGSVGRRISQVLGSIARSLGGLFGKDNQTIAKEGGEIAHVSRVCGKHGADRAWRDVKRRTDRACDEQVS